MAGAIWSRSHGPCRGDGVAAGSRGHGAPTCLGGHRGAQEGLEAGGAELADRPHGAQTPSGAGGAQRAPCGAAAAPCGRDPGQPEASPLCLEQGKAALAAGGSSCRSPRARRSQSPLPARTGARWGARAAAGGSKPHGGHGAGEVHGSSPWAWAACPLPAPDPHGGCRRGIFRAVLSLRIRALSIQSRWLRSNLPCIKGRCIKRHNRLQRGVGSGVLPGPRPRGAGCCLLPAQPRGAEPSRSVLGL